MHSYWKRYTYNEYLTGVLRFFALLPFDSYAEVRSAGFSEAAKRCARRLINLDSYAEVRSRPVPLSVFADSSDRRRARFQRAHGLQEVPP